MANITELKNKAAAIKSATVPESVSASQVGGLFEDVIDFAGQAATDVETAKTVALQSIASVQAATANRLDAIDEALDHQSRTLTKMIIEQGTITGTNNQNGAQASRVRTKGEFVTTASTFTITVNGINGVNAVIASVVFIAPDSSISYAIQTAKSLTFTKTVGTKVRLIMKDADNNDAEQSPGNYELIVENCSGVAAADNSAVTTTVNTYEKCATKAQLDGVSGNVNAIGAAIGSETVNDKVVTLVQGSIAGTSGEDLTQTNRVRTKGYLVTTSARFTLRVIGKNGIDAVIASVVFIDKSGKVSYVIETGKELSYIKDVGTKVRCIFKDNSDNASVQDPSNYELLISNCSGVDATSNYTAKSSIKYNEVTTKTELNELEASIYNKVLSAMRSMIAEDFMAGSRPLRILFLGNSFSVQSVQYLTNLFDACKLKYVVGVSYVGGGGINTYDSNIDNSSYTAAYHKNSGSGWSDVTNNTADKIADENWDYICLQQNSSHADNYENYANIGSLIRKVKAKATNSLVKIAFFATWGWSDLKLQGTAATDKPSNSTSTDMRTMYNNIVSAVNSMMADFGGEIDVLFKCGTALYNQLDYYNQNQLYYSGGTLVQTSLSVGGNDGQHPNLEGVYAATLHIFRTLTKDFGQKDVNIQYSSGLGVTRDLFNNAKASSSGL